VPRTLESIDRLNAKPTASETVDLAGALITFVLAMAGVSERVKAGAELVKAIAKTCAARMDTASPTALVEAQGEPLTFAPAGAARPDAAPIEVNVRQVLDALAILTIEMSVADFLRLLERSVLVDKVGAICMTSSYYASHPEHWSDVAWVHTILAGASVEEQGPARGRVLALHMPNATTELHGMLGETLRIGARQDSVTGSARMPVEVFSSTIIGSKKLVEHQRLCVTARVENDLKPALSYRGIRLQGHRRIPGFSIHLTRHAEEAPLFSLYLISTGVKR